MKAEQLTSKIIKAAFNVHNELGAGFLEKVYHRAMLIELENMGLNTKSEYPINVYYKNHNVGEFYADIFVADTIIVEIKAVENINKHHEVQLVNYLTSTQVDFGLPINFGRSVTVKRKYRTYTPQH